MVRQFLVDFVQLFPGTGLDDYGYGCEVSRFAAFSANRPFIKQLGVLANNTDNQVLKFGFVTAHCLDWVAAWELQ